jgi:hypothetical protein
MIIVISQSQVLSGLLYPLKQIAEVNALPMVQSTFIFTGKALCPLTVNPCPMSDNSCPEVKNLKNNIIIKTVNKIFICITLQCTLTHYCVRLPGTISVNSDLNFSEFSTKFTILTKENSFMKMQVRNFNEISISIYINDKHVIIIKKFVLMRANKRQRTNNDVQNLEEMVKQLETPDQDMLEDINMIKQAALKDNCVALLGKIKSNMKHQLFYDNVVDPNVQSAAVGEPIYVIEVKCSEEVEDVDEWQLKVLDLIDSIPAQYQVTIDATATKITDEGFRIVFSLEESASGAVLYLKTRNELSKCTFITTKEIPETTSTETANFTLLITGLTQNITLEDIQKAWPIDKKPVRISHAISPYNNENITFVDLHEKDIPDIHLLQKRRRFLRTNAIFNLHRSNFTTLVFGFYNTPINLTTAKTDILKALGPGRSNCYINNENNNFNTNRFGVINTFGGCSSKRRKRRNCKCKICKSSFCNKEESKGGHTQDIKFRNKVQELINTIICVGENCCYLVNSNKRIIITLIILLFIPGCLANSFEVVTVNVGRNIFDNMNHLVSLLAGKLGCILIQEAIIKEKQKKLIQGKYINYNFKSSTKKQQETRKEYLKGQIKNLKRKYSEIENEEKLDVIVNQHRAISDKGLLSIISKDVGKIIKEVIDRKHRYIITIIERNTEILIITNVYAPSEGEKENDKFFQVFTNKYMNTVSEIKKMYSNKPIWEVVAGDMNAKVNEELDKKIIRQTYKPKDYDGFNSFMRATKLRDVWRELKGEEKRYTWVKNPSNIKESQETRIDYILTNLPKERIETIEILEFNSAVSKDHKAVRIKITTNEECKLREVMRNESTYRYKTDVLTNNEIKKRLEYFFKPSEEIKELKNEIKNREKSSGKELIMNKLHELIIKELQNWCEKNFRRTNSFSVNNKNKEDNQVNKYKRVMDKLIGIKVKLKKGIVDKENIRKLNTWLPGDIEQVKIPETPDQIKIELEFLKKKIKKLKRKIQVRNKHKKQSRIQTLVNNIQDWQMDKPRRFFEKARGEHWKNTEITYLKKLENNELVYTKEEVKEEFKKFWGGKVFDSKLIINEFGDFLEKLQKRDIIPTTPRFDSEIFKKALDKQRSFTSPGENKIPMEIWKNLNSEMKEILETLMNHAFKDEVIVKGWKDNIIKMIGKVDTPDNATLFRPITLMNCDAKIFTTIIELQLREHLEKNNIIDPLQFGFQKNISTHHALLTLVGIIEDAKKYNRELHIIYLDVAKAYDSVEFAVLKCILEYYKVDIKLINLIVELYSRSGAIMYTPGGKIYVSLRRGVHQGDGLSPLLFILFMNPLIKALRESNLGYACTKNPLVKIPVVGFVDDTKLISSDIQQMKALVSIVEEWCNKTKMDILPQKSCHTYRGVTGQVEVIKIANKEVPIIPPNKSKRVLGIWLNLELDWKEQEDMLKKQTLEFIGNISGNCFTNKQKITVINKMLFPRIDYRTSVAWMSDKSNQKLDLMITKAMKREFKINKNIRNERLWATEENRGWNLERVTDHQITSYVTKYTNLIWNNQHQYPKKVFQALWSDEEIKELNNGNKGDNSITMNALIEVKNKLPINYNIRKKGGESKGWYYKNLKFDRNMFDIWWDKDKNVYVVPIFVDGSWSRISGKAGAAVWLKENSKLNMSWEIKDAVDNIHAELAALEYAFSICPIDAHVVIIYDCESAVKLIENTILDYKRVEKTGYGSILIRTYKRRREVKSKSLEFVKVTSHSKEKLTKAIRENDNDKIERINSNVRSLVNRFGTWFTVKNGNDSVDLMAKKPKLTLTSQLYEETPDFTFFWKGKKMEGKLRALIQEELKNTYGNLIRARSKKENQVWDKIDIENSNKIMGLQHYKYAYLQDWMFKLSINQLYLQGIQFPRTNKDWKSFYDTKKSIEYPTFECESCKNDILDLYHLLTCKETEKQNRKCDNYINRQIKKLLKENNTIIDWRKIAKEEKVPRNNTNQIKLNQITNTDKGSEVKNGINKEKTKKRKRESEEIKEKKRKTNSGQQIKIVTEQDKSNKKKRKRESEDIGNTLKKKQKTHKTYCICKKPDEGEYIQCEYCEEWYHPECINMSKKEYKKLKKSNEKYKCKKCIDENETNKLNIKDIAVKEGLTTKINLKKREDALKEWKKIFKNRNAIQFRIAQGFLPKEWTSIINLKGKNKKISEKDQQKLIRKISLKILWTIKKDYNILRKKQREWRKNEGIELRSLNLRYNSSNFRDNSVK